ncbi:MAG: MoaD/ThiS family protein, partial [Gammaproteobacteria bacterium]
MKVSLTGPIRDALGGVASINVEATTIRELMQRLEDRYPAIERLMETGIAVAINGEIYRDRWGEAIPPG